MEDTNTIALENDAGFMDKYSRQIGAFGLETMAKLVRLRVLIVGLQGVGIECAKNLILAGPGKVTLYDDELTEMKDLGANFFLNEDDVGHPRAGAVAHKLAELNKTVSVGVHKGELTEDLIRKYSIVVFTRGSRAELLRWNAFCRSQSPAIGFLLCELRGAMGYTFTDFGPQFTVFDATGEPKITRIITDITNDTDGVLSILGPDEDGKMHELPDSDHDGWIELSDVDGMELVSDSSDSKKKSINDMGPRRIAFAKKKVYRNGKQVEVFDPYRLKIGDTSMFSAYEGGGVMTQFKKPYTICFRSLEESLVSPVNPGEYGLMFTDGAKFGRAEQLHVGIWSIMEFEFRHGHLPEPHNVEHADEVVAIAKEGIKHYTHNGEQNTQANIKPLELEEIDEKVVRNCAQYAAIELQPLAAFFGGVLAQEIVKFTGKFTPLNQWLHLDVFEVLPDSSAGQLDLTPSNSRYDNIIMMFGKDFHNKLMDLHTFVVGCGALGCEFLKNFAMVGLACGPNGLVTVTDNDRIEVSNLNRQFLFREHNVGQPKSVAAANAVIDMNKDLKLKPLEHLVAPSTETIFHDKFWSSLDVVTNALDNVKARLYVDSMCVFHKLPLVESGTLGTKCNVQVVIPFKTQSYADGPKDKQDDAIPMCTLRNFPSLIEHCIEWARAQFEDIFVAPAAEAKKFVTDRHSYLHQVAETCKPNPRNPLGSAAAALKELERLKTLKIALRKGEGITFEKCMHMAMELLLSSFRDRILQLIHSFPEDHTSASGEKFWSGAKRFPQPCLTFDPVNNPLHLEYVRSTANILAVCYGLQVPPDQEVVPEDSEWRDLSTYKNLAESYEFPTWKPTNEKIAVDTDDAKKLEEEKVASCSPEAIQAELKTVIDELANMDISNLNFEPADFEKDHDANFHIDFIYAASNLRAWNYRISQTSRHHCKMIAGKIIPAIATTTASVTGLAMIELLKLLQNKPLEAFKDSSNSLGLNLYLMQEPAEPTKAKDEYDVVEMAEVKCRPPGFTKWDSTIIEIPSNATLSEFLSIFKECTQLNCDLLFHRIAEQGSASSDARLKRISGLMLYDRNAFGDNLKRLYESQMDQSLREWVDTRYENAVDTALHHIEFQTSCSDDDGNVYKIPTVVCKFT